VEFNFGLLGDAMPSDRGILYMKWGTGHDQVLQRSLASVKAYHPELPVQVVELPASANLLNKAEMFERSPFEETLFLDVDTVVLDRLDFGFEKAARFGIACCICECPWARRYGGLRGDMIEYNTGVLFFNRAMTRLFETWKTNNARVDSSILFKGPNGQLVRMPLNDQAGFAKAIDDLEICPYVLPLNWNFRPLWQRSFFGPIKIWHDYGELPNGIHEWNARQRGEQKVIEYTRLG
jgi:hypothetical protein